MFRTKQQVTVKAAASRKAAPSVISADMNILGNIISEGFIDIDGRVEGNIKCFSVTIRQNGRIKGDIFAETVHVYGEVKGLIKAKTVHFFSTCKVEGVIMHESLSIEDGAFVDGKFKRTDKVFIEDEEATTSSTGSNDPENLKVLENLKLIG